MTTRRTALRNLGAVVVTTGVAGCTGSDDDPAGTTDGPTDSETTEDAGGLEATLATSKGDVRIELYEDRVPTTVENFVGLAEGTDEESVDVGPGTGAWRHPETGQKRTDPLYSDVLVHRVIEDFMIQTGDPTGTGRGGPGYTFDDEFHDELSHDAAGVVSMANSGPDTNGSQFFITLDAQPHLDDRHAVFGSVVDGMSVVEEIGSVPTDAADGPTEDIRLDSVEIHR